MTHPPRSILAVAEEVIAHVRAEPRFDDALEAYAPGHENVHVRWLSKLRGYEVTLRFDAETFDRDAFAATSAAPAEHEQGHR